MEEQVQTEPTVNPQTPSPMPPKSNKGRAQIILVACAVLVVLAGSVWWLTSKNKSPSVDNSVEQAALELEPVKVVITKDGFVPATIKVKKGQKVTWTNDDGAIRQIAVGPHPEHSQLPGFASDPLNQDASYSFTFDKAGTFSYHDEKDPRITGTVIVE